MLYLHFRDLKKSLLFSFLASLPLHVGKAYEIDLVSAWELNIAFRPYGIADFIVISIREIICALMLVYLLRTLLVRGWKSIKLDTPALGMIIFFVGLLVASSVSSIRPEISLVHCLYFLEPLIFYFFLKLLLNERKKIIFSSLSVLAVIVFFLAFLASLQFVKQGTWGTSLEISHDFLPLSLGIDEDIFLFRPLGTFYHPNELAQFLLPLLFIFMPFLFVWSKDQKDKVWSRTYILTFLAGLWVLLLSFGRSAWLSFIICLLVFFYVLEKRWHLRLRIKKEVIKLIIIVIPFMLPIIIFFVLPRVFNSFFTFESYGGGSTRWELMKKSLATIGRFPLFGVGLSMDVYYTYQNPTNKPGDVFSYFPESVHNGYLYLVSQIGIPLALLFYWLCYLFIKRIFMAVKKSSSLERKIINLAVFLGVAAIFINNLFQAYLPDLPLLVFLSMIYGNYGNQKKKFF